MSKDGINPEERNLPFSSFIALRGMGGDPPEACENHTGKTKTAILARNGWRILPIPDFWERGALWHDEKGGGNPACIDFSHPREWLVIPPDEYSGPAQKFSGRRPAIQWAWARAVVS